MRIIPHSVCWFSRISDKTGLENLGKKKIFIKRERITVPPLDPSIYFHFFSSEYLRKEELVKIRINISSPWHNKLELILFFAVHS